MTDTTKFEVLREGDAPDPRVEVTANIIHRAWAHWTEYFLESIKPLLPIHLHTVQRGEGVEYLHPGAEIAFRKIDGWTRQIRTPYDALTEKEKDADREWAYEILRVITNWENAP